MRFQSSRLQIGAFTALSLFSFVSVRADEPKAAAQTDAKPIKLSYVRKMGEITRYKATQTNTINGMEVPSESIYKVMVKEVRSSLNIFVIGYNSGHGNAQTLSLGSNGRSI